MAFTREQLESEFICPKCHNKGAQVQELQFGRSVAIVIPMPSTRFLSASCALCGYTEFYNMAIAIKADQPAGVGVQPALASESGD